MRRLVVGTAGHIDHGKTRLVEALTGIDCDRWDEEKTRGITIDLGFAHFEEGDLQLGFVDVPGHRRFLHNALAGLGAIRLVLLVVSAEEGVKPQTREHLDICNLLGISHALVALTKTDLVSADIVELAQLEVEELLAETALADAPILPVSSVTGEGLEELKAELVRLARQVEPPPAAGHPARLPVDRAFHLKGRGAVITGSLVSGVLKVGDTLELTPGEEPVRIRSLQVHDNDREKAYAGERTAAQLTGASLEELRRGHQVVEKGVFGTARSICARFTLLAAAPKALSGNPRIRLHHYTAESLGRMRLLDREELAPGESGLVEIRLRDGIPAVRGDRFIIRRPSPAMTLGGGIILDSRWPRVRGNRLAPALKALEVDEKTAAVLWVQQAGEGGAGLEDLAPRLGWRTADLEPLLVEASREQLLLEIPAGKGHGRRWIVPAAFGDVEQRCRALLKEYFRQDRMARGMPKAEAISRLLPGRSAELAETYLDWLSKRQVLVLRGDLVDLPGRQATLTDTESSLAKDLHQAVLDGGLTPDSPPDIGRRIGAKPAIMEGVLRYLTERRRIVRLPGGLLVASETVERVINELRSGDWERFGVGTFKDHFGVSRKWAIPWLEHLDSTGVTRRVGNERMIVGRKS